VRPELDKSILGGYTEHRKGAAGERLAPYNAIEVTACLEAGRLLLFVVMYLDDQVHNANDNQTELEQL